MPGRSAASSWRIAVKSSSVAAGGSMAMAPRTYRPRDVNDNRILARIGRRLFRTSRVLLDGHLRSAARRGPWSWLARSHQVNMPGSGRARATPRARRTCTWLTRWHTARWKPQGHPRAPVRAGPGVHPARHKRRGQPTVRPRGHGSGRGRGALLASALYRLPRIHAVRQDSLSPVMPSGRLDAEESDGELLRQCH
jgi:hypothetical protein